MSTHLHPLHLRRVLGPREWRPPQPHGPDGWALVRHDRTGSVFVSCADYATERGIEEWVHASIAYRDHHPSYDDLVLLHKAVWRGKGWAYQVFAPPDEHINIHAHALHLWGRLDGAPVLPNFPELAGVRSI